MSKLKSKLKQKKVDRFQIEGKLSGFIFKNDRQIKYLKITSKKKKYRLKLPKNLRNQINADMIGSRLEITGDRKKNSKTGKVKLKVKTIELVEQKDSNKRNLPLTAQKPLKNKKNKKDKKIPTAVKKSAKTKILVCNKSSCQKKGGRAVCQELNSQIKERHLEENTQIKLTGCLNKCKKGPNLVVTPDKAFYSKVKPKQIPLILEKHC